jgi:hypothetical protein
MAEFDLFLPPKRPWNLSIRQNARLVDKWVSMIELEPRAYGPHSLRRTKAALIYKKTGNLRACQLPLGAGNLRARSDTLASRSMTRSRCLSKSTSRAVSSQL